MKIFVVFIILVLSHSISAQEYYNLSGDIVVKEKFSDNKYSISKGKFSYNKHTGACEYLFHYPENEKYKITKDSLIIFKNNKLIYSVEMPFLSAYSIFELFLKGTFKDFGLQNSIYEINKIEKKTKEKIYITWLPKKEKRKEFGKIILSQYGNKLNGVILYSVGNKVIQKIFFNKYIKLKSLDFPTEIIEINYFKSQKITKITEFSNLTIN